jgi:hypothetical protein
MALPVNYTLELYRGDSYRRQFRLWANLLKTEPVDLTGVVASAAIRSSPPKTESPILLTCSIAANIIDVALSAGDSLVVPVSGQWDLQLTYPSGEIRTIVAGSVIVQGETTGAQVVTPPVPVREVAHV